MPLPPTALIAEDEPLLAQALQAALARAWPELQIVASVGDGVSAVAQALRLQPQLLFFDIQMPGLDGLEAAAALAEQWPADQPFPALVFVTAFDHYAVQAFEAQAVDYLLKPVQPARLQKTVAKLRLALDKPAPAAMHLEANLETTMARLRALLQATPAPVAAPPLQFVQASVGSSVHLVPVDEVLYFEATDKYLRVVTATHDYLVRTPLKELLPQLDPARFWQIHRGTVVHSGAIARVQRDDSGKLQLLLRQRPERLVVSRLYAHLFKAM